MLNRLMAAMLIAMAIVAVATASGVAVADEPDDPPLSVVNEDPDTPFATEGAFIEIGGVRSPIQTGYRIESSDAVTIGAEIAEDGCLLPEIHIGGRLTPTSNSGHIVASIGVDCSISITDITVSSLTTSASTGSRSSDGATRYKGWAKSELNDPIDIDLTSTYARMYYYDDGSTVYGGHNKKLKCGYFPDGWYVISCNGSWWPTGPNSVYIKLEGEFDHHFISPARHWQMAKFRAEPGYGTYTCGHSGRVLGPVHWKCSGSKFAH